MADLTPATSPPDAAVSCQAVAAGEAADGPRGRLDRDQLTAWLGGHGFALDSVEALPGDVSSRCYFRLVATAPSPSGGRAPGPRVTLVLAVYPENLDAVCRRFLATTALLTTAGVRVPRVLASECGRGWVLLEDVGEETLYEWSAGRAWSELAPLYHSILAPMRQIAELPAAPVAELSPPLDRTLLRRELDKTWSTFLTPRRLAGERAMEQALRAALEHLCAAIAAVPAVPCHRDLTPRNLVPLAGGRLAVLDHQDLRLGPPLYDLASLLNDSLFPPLALEEELLVAWGLAGEDRVDYHRVAAQRTLKAVGSYAGAAAAGNPRRLDLIPATLARALDHLARAPETRMLTDELAILWQPVL